jgi:hypothetical protein
MLRIYNVEVKILLFYIHIFNYCSVLFPHFIVTFIWIFILHSGFWIQIRIKTY